MHARNHCHFTRGNVQNIAPPEQVLLVPQQPIQPEPVRHREPIKIEKFAQDKKHKSRFQRG